MAKREKKISFNTVDKILDTEKPENTEVVCNLPDGSNITVTVRRRLSFQDFLQYVSQVVDGVFVDLDDGTIYTPENLDISYIYATLRYYTNIKEDMKIEKLYAFGMTDFYQKIVDQIDFMQFKSLKTAIDSTIDFRKQELLSAQQELLNRNIEKIENLIGTVSKFATVFENIDISEMTETFQKIAEKDERGLVNAILNLRSENSAVGTSSKETLVEDQLDGQIDFGSIETEV